MVLQETFGEFDSTQRLRSLIKLICQLPGTYEVLIKAESGEEGILHCANDTIKNAAWRDLSGVEALAQILSWDRGKYWLEELPVLPVRTISLPLDKLFAETDKRMESEQDAPASESSAAAPSDSQVQSPGPMGEIPVEASPSDEASPVEEMPPVTPPVPVTPSVPLRGILSINRSIRSGHKEITPVTPVTPVVSEDKPSVPATFPATPPATPAKTPPTPPGQAGKALPDRIAAIKGVNGVIIASSDGMLVSAVNIEPESEQVQMVALLGEALEAIGGLFGKGKLLHGVIDMMTDRTLIHPLGGSFAGTFVGSQVSAAVVGSEIERIIVEEAG